ncbi:MAG: hypothetical protein EHM91_00145 [Planctomycetota bacterium]|nr:MAG: hypothetical protein EHM91_00145 [Planctomycetota bacterium]
MSLRLALVVALVALVSSCAAKAVWLDGTALVVEDYASARVRLYRAGVHCRLEVITLTETVVTLPTRCVSVPRRATP